MRKILVLICCLMMVVCFAACGETQEAATETTDSFGALMFDTKITTIIAQADAEFDYLYDYMDIEENKKNPQSVIDKADEVESNLFDYSIKLEDVTSPGGNSAEEYKITAIFYVQEMELQCLYISLFVEDAMGISATDYPELQAILDEGDRIDKVYDWKRQVIDNRKAFLLDCGEFKDEAAVDAYLAEYPYPAEY